MKIMQSLLPWRSFHGKNIQSHLRSRAWAVLLSAAAILALLLSTASSSFAGSATWLASPATGDWDTAGNWTAGGPPAGFGDTATFDLSDTTGVSVASGEGILVDGIVFNAGASAFTITASTNCVLFINGAGITNNSGITQNFVIAGGGGGPGEINFRNSATAGSGAVFTNSAGPFSNQRGGFTEFDNTSTAGSSIFINNNGSSTGFIDTSTAADGTFINNAGEVGGGGGATVFFGNATAGNATLIANGGVNGGAGGVIFFETDSLGGTARVEVFGNGNLDLSFHNAPGVTIGSVEGSGAVFLGAFNLTVGSNNLSTTFSGVIQDGGFNGGTGGSLAKIGTGTLTLTNANTYTGGTTLSTGTLLVKNKTGSATGTGAMQVNSGTLGGTGKIAGAITVGTGSGTGAFVSPGPSAKNPGTLTINSTLTFNSDSIYRCVLNRTKIKASKVTALGVTINSGAQFAFADLKTGTLTQGTVFRVINNTSASPIVGAFSNLADGTVFTSNGNNFKVNYEGGTGNDLTLTVVP